MDKIKGNESLHSEIEVEEVHDDSDEQERHIQDQYNERKHSYALRIMSELEGFVQRPANEWRTNEEEYELIDILSLVDNIIKAQLGDNERERKR